MSTVLGDPVAEPPLDGVSRVRFSPAAAAAGGGSATLLATSWDGSARLYDASSGAARGVYAHAAPLLDCSFGDDGGTFFTGGLDCRVVRCVRVCVCLEGVGHAEEQRRLSAFGSLRPFSFSVSPAPLLKRDLILV